MKILNNKVLVEEVKQEQGEGIQIASSAKSNYTLIKGKVINHFEEDAVMKMTYIEIGDEILFAWGDKVNIDGKDLYLVDYSNIACIL